MGGAIQAAMRSTDSGFTEATALAWLAAAGRIDTSCSGLAAAWGWSTSKVKRHLVRWSAAGRIERRTAADRTGTLIVYRGEGQSEPPVVRTRSATVKPCGATKSPAAKPDLYRWFGGVSPPRRTTATDHRTTSPDQRTTAPGRSIAARSVAFVTGAALAMLGLGMGYVSMRINQGFGASMASTDEAAQLWQQGSLLADLFKMVALAGASVLWGAGRKSFAGALAAAWLVTVVYAIMAAAGFTSMNIADSTAKRGSVASERERLATDIVRLRSQLGWNAAVEEPRRRSAASAAIALQEAQPKVPPATWKATSGCTDVTIEPSREACRVVLSLRAELDAARRRETAEKELRQKEARLGELPKVAAADPQAETISRVVHWLSFGQTSFGEGDVQLVRFLLILLVIELPGALGLSAGIEIWRKAVFV